MDTTVNSIKRSINYHGRYAEWFDLFYADKPYSAEVEFLHRCITENSSFPVKQILEIACGTGNHALLLERYGYTIVATDYSQDMLACAKRKAEEKSSNLDFRCQDMRFLDIPERPFDAVLCLFDSIGYAADNVDLDRVFSGVKSHLRPDGLFIFEFWHAGAMLRHYDPIRIRRCRTPDGEVLRIAETKLDYTKQIANVTYTFYELKNDGTYTSYQETHVNRFFLVQEMNRWLSTHGFIPIKWFSGYTRDELITENTWHVLTIARCLP